MAAQFFGTFIVISFVLLLLACIAEHNDKHVVSGFFMLGCIASCCGIVISLLGVIWGL